LLQPGARVTVFDNSPGQLEQDRKVVAREDLEIKLVQGDMVDLSVLPGESYDLGVHPVSNTFVSAIQPVWNEAARVLKPGGVLLAGFVNPLLYLFSEKEAEQGKLVVVNEIPYANWHNIEEGEPVEFSHTPGDQIGGQIEAGLVITGFLKAILGERGSWISISKVFVQPGRLIQMTNSSLEPGVVYEKGRNHYFN